MNAITTEAVTRVPKRPAPEDPKNDRNEIHPEKAGAKRKNWTKRIVSLGVLLLLLLLNIYSSARCNNILGCEVNIKATSNTEHS